MVLYHAFIFSGNKQTVVCEDLYRVFFFFMPWFFFKSGMFAKTTSLMSCITSSFRKLLIPYMVFSVFGYAAYAVKQIILGDISIQRMIIEPASSLIFTGSISGNLPLWFLLGLFFARVFWQLFTLIKLNRIQIGFLSFLICFLGHVLAIKYPFYLWFAFSGLLFYTLGDIFKTIQHKRGCFFLCVVLYILAIIVFPNSVQMRSNSLEMGFYFLWPITSMAAIVVWNNGSRLFEHIQGKTLATRMLWRGGQLIGHNSMYIYVSHSLIIVPVSAACTNISNDAHFVILCVALMLLLPIFTFCTKYILEKVDISLYAQNKL